MSLEKKKLRIALCYRGRAAGYSKGNEVRALEGQWATIQKYIIQHHDADVFLHCWSPEVKDQLLETYKPVKYIIEDEIVFDSRYRDGMENININKNFAALKKIKASWAPHHKLSVLYSICKSIELKREYEKEHNIKYDAVFVLRYDLDFIENFDYSILAGEMKKNILITSVCCTLSGPVLPGSYTGLRVWDLWLAGSSEVADIISSSFSVMKESEWYKKEASASIHLMWNKFFELIDFHKDGKLVVPYRTNKNPIARLTRDQKKKKKQ